MKKITKAQQDQIDAAIKAADDSQSDLVAAIEEYNQHRDEIVAVVEQALETYNDKLQAIKDVYEGIAEEARAYYDERSEKWQEGDAGTNYNEWIDTLEAVEFDEVELDLPDELPMPDFPDFSEELAPSEPEA